MDPATLALAKRASLQRAGSRAEGPIALPIAALPSPSTVTLTPVVGSQRVDITGSDTHNAFPGLALLRDGSLLVAWRDGPGHGAGTGASRGVVKVARSTDLGVTWGDAVTVIDFTTDDARDPTLTELSDGTVLLTAFRSDGAGNPIQGCYVTRSHDGGVTWGAPTVMQGGFANRNIIAGWIVELDDGTLLAPIYGWGAEGQSASSAAVLRSADRGVTWSELAVVADGPTDGLSYVEPVLTVLASGDIAMLIREDTTDQIYMSTSSDGGATWTAPAAAFAGEGRPATITTAAGTLLTVYRGNASPNTGATLLRASFDDGVTWTAPSVIDQVTGESCVYAQLVEAAPGVIAVAYAHETTATDKSQVRFRYLLHGLATSPLGDTLGGHLAWETRLRVDTAEVEIAGIAVPSNRQLEVSIVGGATASTNILMYLNDDETDANYVSQRVRAYGTTVEADHSDTPRIGFFSDQNVGEQAIVARIMGHDGFRRTTAMCHYSQVVNYTSGNIATGQITYGWENAAVVTKLKLKAATGDIRSGTTISLRVI